MTTSEVCPNESRIQFISVIIVASGNPSGFVGSRDHADEEAAFQADNSTVAPINGGP